MLATAPSGVVGHSRPRIGPPPPLRHGLGGYRAAAVSLGIDSLPWQDTAATYATALDPDGRWLYRDVAVIVARQNGKTWLVKPLIVQRLLAGRRIMHIAQVRELPRIMHQEIADALEASDPDLFPRRRGKVIWARRGVGSESIVLANGGSYRIAAAMTGGARGHSFDDLVIDELREMDSFDVINAAKPAQRASANPQTIYLSNAGTDESVVLNSLRTRSGDDPSLAYLEWSADPEYDDDDRRGWLQANPAIGHIPSTLRDLEMDYVGSKLAGNLSGFETEALCRWVPTLRPRLVDDFAWMRCRVGSVSAPRRPALGIGMDPSGTRASVVMAWRQADGSVALRELYDVPGEPIDTDALGEDAAKTARRVGATAVGYDDWTDRDLARHFRKKAKSIIGKDFANASEAFVRAVGAGTVHWVEAEHITADLVSTSRKDNSETGTYHAVKSRDDVPITAALAAIRAFWLASAAQPPGSLMVM